MTNRETKLVIIPDGLNSERVDAALARLLGISRSTIVDLIEAGEVKRHNKALGKSDRLNTDDRIEILMPEQKTRLRTRI